MSHNKLNLHQILFWLGITFLYLPMIILVIFSFNESKLVTVWTGFSGKWYLALLQDQEIMNAVGRSFQVAFFSATAAVALAILASIVMVRFTQFKTRTLFNGCITAPLVMPDVIIGLSMLLLFVSMSQLIEWPQQRGLLTIWIAHTTFGLAYSTIVISSRLREMDRSLEEAALDLGASHIKAFLLITLPIIAPAIISAWLLSFTLSLDDVVIASFVTGPGGTTLPIEVLSSVRLGVTPKINALASIIIAIVFCIAFISWLTSRHWNEKNRIK
jgi:putrescine transport system permease protein